MVLRSCQRAAQIDGHLDTLPLFGVRMPRAYCRQPSVLTIDEVFVMIDTASAGWQRAIATALFTGLPLDELLALSGSDMDLAARRIALRANLAESNSRQPRLLREEPKSRAGLRQVPIVEALAARLQLHLEQFGSTADHAEFASPVGTWMSKSNFYRDAWNPTRHAAGHPELRFHDLRHTAASLMQVVRQPRHRPLCRSGGKAAARSLPVVVIDPPSCGRRLRSRHQAVGPRTREDQDHGAGLFWHLRSSGCRWQPCGREEPECLSRDPGRCQGIGGRAGC